MKMQLNKEKRVIAYAIIGDLQNSIEVEDFKFEYPIQDYVYEKGKIKYKPKPIDLTELKLRKNEELKRIRTEKINANISMFGGEFQVRNFEDIENFNDLERGLKNGKLKANDKMSWRLADNTFKEFSVGQLTKILDAKAERKSIIYDDFRKIAEQLWACKTVEEIEEIEWK